MFKFIQNNKTVQGLVPVADAWAADPATDIVSLANYKNATFIVNVGAGATGTATLTVESCDDVSGTTTTAVPFTYAVSTTTDTYGALQQATAAGFTTTAGGSDMYIVEINSMQLSGTDKFVRLQFVEAVDSPVTAGTTIVLSDPRYASDSDIMPTAIV